MLTFESLSLCPGQSIERSKFPGHYQYTMVDVFGQRLKGGPIGPQGDEGPPRKKGDKGDPGKNCFNELFNWFPQFAVEQIRKHVNFIKFYQSNNSKHSAILSGKINTTL